MSKKKNNQATRGERLCRTLLTMLMIAAALWGTWHLLIPKPAIADNKPPTTSTPAPGRQEAPGGAGSDEPGEDGPYKRRDNCWTFLLIGMDRGGGNTDSLMLVTYDVAKQSVSVGSIARDTRVDVERKLKKINAAYAMNGGVDGVKEEVSRTFGVPIDFYFRVNLRGFTRLVDAVGGIDFNIPCYMDYDDPEQELAIHYSKGTRHLNGQQALEVCRFRQNNDGSGYGDGGRQQTQRAVLTAVLKKRWRTPASSTNTSASRRKIWTPTSISAIWRGLRQRRSRSIRRTCTRCPCPASGSTPICTSIPTRPSP